MRHWAYEALGDSKILEFVVMATPDDIDANAEFIAEADFYVEVPPGPNSNNYANLHLIVQVGLVSRLEGSRLRRWKYCGAVSPGGAGRLVTSVLSLIQFHLFGGFVPVLLYSRFCMGVWLSGQVPSFFPP